MKRTSTRMPFAVFEGGIVRLSRCLRESLIPHFIRDCPTGILRKLCLLVEPKRFRPYPQHSTK